MAYRQQFLTASSFILCHWNMLKKRGNGEFESPDMFRLWWDYSYPRTHTHIHIHTHANTCAPELVLPFQVVGPSNSAADTQLPLTETGVAMNSGSASSGLDLNGLPTGEAKVKVGKCIHTYTYVHTRTHTHTNLTQCAFNTLPPLIYAFVPCWVGPCAGENCRGCGVRCQSG